MGATEAAPPPQAAAPAQQRAAGGPVVVDAEGRPVSLGARGGGACAAAVCYGLLLFSYDDVQQRKGPARAPSTRRAAVSASLARLCQNMNTTSRESDAARPPQRCWGLKLRREGVSLPAVSSTGAPTTVSGPFRFSCAGKGVHLLREGPPGAAAGVVDLPYCEGLEVRRPLVLKE